MKCMGKTKSSTNDLPQWPPKKHRQAQVLNQFDPQKPVLISSLFVQK
jgi:hypothetical protein